MGERENSESKHIIKIKYTFTGCLDYLKICTVIKAQGGIN